MAPTSAPLEFVNKVSSRGNEDASFREEFLPPLLPPLRLWWAAQRFFVEAEPIFPLFALARVLVGPAFFLPLFEFNLGCFFFFALLGW